MFGKHTPASVPRHGEALLRLAKPAGDLTRELVGRRHGGNFTRGEEIRHQRPAIGKLKGSAGGQLERARVDEIPLRIESGPGPRMQVEIHRARVKYLLTGVGIDPCAVALQHRGQIGRAIPLIAPEFESPLVREESRKDRAAVRITCANKRDIRSIFLSLSLGQLQGTVHGWIGCHGKIAHILRASLFKRGNAGLVLDHEPKVIARRQLLPIGQVPVVLDKPHCRQKPFSPELFQHREN